MNRIIRQYFILIRKNFPLLLVIAIAFLLRFIGTKPGYNQFHSDEGVTYSAAVSMIKNGNLDPLRYDYPALVPLVNYLFFKFIFIPLNWGFYYVSHIFQIFDGTVHIPIAPLEKAKVFQIFILGEREINALFWGRYVTALFSLANVYLVYKFGKKLFNKRIGLFAALFLAVNFRAVTNAHIGLPDTYNAFFLLLSLIFSYRVIDKPTVKNYLLAGIFIGFSISIKYQIFAVFPFLFSHLYASHYSLRKLFSLRIILSGFVAITIFIFLNPYLLINYQLAIEIISYVSKKYGMGKNSLMTFPFYYFIHFDYGLLLFILSLIGIGFSFKKFSKQTLFILSAIIPFFFIMIFYSNGGFYIRNFITITPLIMLFAAVAINYCIIFSNKWVLIISTIGAIIIPFKNALINSYFYTKPWSYKEILTKVGKILPSNSLVASHPFDPLPKDVLRSDFSSDYSYSLAEFREDKANYALINMDWASNNFYGWMTTSFPESSKYLLDKPITEMRNTYWGISIEEMMNFVQVFSFKPWQAADAALFLIKIPYFNNVKFNSASDVNLNDWFVFPYKNSGNLFFEKRIVSNGKTELIVGPGTVEKGIIRFVSGEINVKSNHVYKITGIVESLDTVIKKDRTVFIRVDFYDKDFQEKKNEFATSVSSRYFGEGEKELEIITISPSTASKARISIQTHDNIIHSYLLKNVKIEESEGQVNLNESYEKIEFNQYKDLLYPNSHGNL